MTNGSFSHFRRSSAQLRAPKERRRRREGAAKAPRRRREGAAKAREGAAKAREGAQRRTKYMRINSSHVVAQLKRCCAGEGGAKGRKGGAKAPQRPAKRGRKCEKDRLVIGFNMRATPEFMVVFTVLSRGGYPGKIGFQNFFQSTRSPPPELRSQR